jgi:serine phosphatase RsbU (regulator of sigma subunit)/anti-sigma regulatory factor (Ser/Thr protein kinase)
VEVPLRQSHCTTFRVTFNCSLAEIRPATRAARRFLQEQGLADGECSACELALAEACNNAVLYVSEAGRFLPIQIVITSNEERIEMIVNDHTPGFIWTDKVVLPDVESEGGRGLYLIQSLMDRADYFLGQGHNSLVMHLNRAGPHPLGASSGNEPNGGSQSQVEISRQALVELARELCHRSEKLAAIFRCSSELGRSGDLVSFAARTLDDLMEVSSSHWYVVRLIPRNEDRLVVFTASPTIGQLESISIPQGADFPAGRSPPLFSVPRSIELQAVLERREVNFNLDEPLHERDPVSRICPYGVGMVVPLQFGESILGTLAVGRSGREYPYTDAQKDMVRTFTDLLSIQIANARIREEQLQVRCARSEAEVARKIQRSLLPKSLPALSHCEIAGFSESAYQVGGDFYDVIQIPSQRSILLVIADVMGKGVPAAIFASVLRSLVRAMPEWGDSPARLLNKINRAMFDVLTGVEMFITAQIALLKPGETRLRVASAGHCPMLIAQGDGRIQSVSPEGMPLGILPNTRFDEEQVELKSEWRILLYTDGLTEARNEGGELFGLERLHAMLRKSTLRGRTALETKKDFEDELGEFQKEGELLDDQTFLILSEQSSGLKNYRSN